MISIRFYAIGAFGLIAIFAVVAAKGIGGDCIAFQGFDYLFGGIFQI